GSEFRVNTYTVGSQNFAAVAMSASGAFVIVWQSDGQDGSGWGLYGQRYNSSGLPQGSEFRVNTETSGHQVYPRIAMNSSGQFVVTWETFPLGSSPQDVHAQRFDPLGVPVGSEFLVNTYTDGDQGDARPA